MSVENKNNVIEATVIRHAVLKELRAADERLRDQLNAELSPGTKVTGAIDGKPIGTVTKTFPKKKAKVTDKYQVLAWAAENMPGALRERISDIDAAIDVLREHAPDLLTPDIPDYEMNVIIRRVEAGEDIPGVELVEGKPTLQVRSQKAEKIAKEIVHRMVQQDFMNEINQRSMNEIEG